MPRPPSNLWNRQSDPDKAAPIVYQLAQNGEQVNLPRREQCTRYASMYEATQLQGLDGDFFFGSDELISYDQCPLINNRCEAIADTLQSKLSALDEPRPQFVVTDGSYEQKRQAVWLDRFVEGQYYQPQMNGMFQTLWELWRQAFLIAAAATGSVAVKIYPDFNAKKIQCELHNTLDMWLDPAEVRYGGPLTYGESTWVDAEMLLDTYSRSQKKTRAIIAARDSAPERIGSPKNKMADDQQVRVHEIWRVRTTADEPGKYAKVVGNTSLEFDDYDYATPPYAFYHFKRRLGGFWGRSATASIYHSVIRENQVLNRMDEGEARSQTQYVFYDPTVPGANKIAVPKHVIMIPYDPAKGNPVMPFTPNWYPQTAPELMGIHAKNAHDVSGVAAMQTTGQAQQGLTAAVAIRTVLSLLNERLAPRQRDIVNAQAVQSAYLIARAAKELYAKFGSFDSQWFGKSFVKTLPGADCLSLPQDICVANIRPVSEKKNSPEDRVQLAQELVSQGVITGGHWLGILQHMDTVGAMKQFEIVEQWCEWQFDKWRHAPEAELDMPGFYTSPPKNMDLDYAMALTVDALLTAQIDEVPDNRRQLFLKFMGDLDRKIDQRDARRAAQGLPPKGPGAMPPEGVPATQPVAA